MDRSNVVNLVTFPFTTNEQGVRIKGEAIKRRVFCHIDSVTGAEYFNGGQTGIRPQYRITMFRFDYQGEEVVELDGELFTVYRTYISRNDNIELYVERRKGNAEN